MKLNIPASALLVIMLLLLAGLPVTAQDAVPSASSTLTVTRFDDSFDGVCNNDCSLRDAVEVANKKPGADTILLAAGTYTLTIPALFAGSVQVEEDNNVIGDLDITDHLTLRGADSLATIIVGKTRDRVLEVLPNVTVQISDLTISGGNTYHQGGGIANQGDLTLAHVRVTKNSASGFEGGGGGGVWNNGTLLIQQSTIAANSAAAAGDAPPDSLLTGGGIANEGVLKLLASAVQDNFTSGNLEVSLGGGIVNRGDALISGSTVLKNNTEAAGGGIANLTGGVLTVVNSTIAGNDVLFSDATEASGGLANGWVGPAQTIPGGVVSLFNVTISGNGSGGVHNHGELQVANSIIAGNLKHSASAFTCVNQGTFHSLGANLMDDAGDCPHDGAGDIVVGYAAIFTSVLAPLTANNDTTATYALLPGSAALDAGNDTICANAPVNGVDQRGTPRPQGAHCDIGAYEGVADHAFVVTKFDDGLDGTCDADCSLREAIQAANQQPGQDYVVTVPGVYHLSIPTTVDGDGDTVDEDANAIGDLDIADDLVLVGAFGENLNAVATVIDGNQHDRVLEVLQQAKVTIHKVAIQGGRVSSVGAGLSNSGHLTLDRVEIHDNLAASGFDIGHGGGIFNDGNLTIHNSHIDRNAARGGEASYGEGGGIRNDGTLTMYLSSLTDNTTSDDNDVGIGGGLLNRGVAYLEACTISNNSTSAGGEGGGIANQAGGQLTMPSSTLENNRAGANGGAIANDADSQLVLGAPGLLRNSAGNYGGGIYNAGGLDFTGGEPGAVIYSVVGNTAFEGGGIYNTGTATLTGIAVAENTTQSGIPFRGHGGGIYNTGSMTLRLTLVEYNKVYNTGATDSFGGGIYNAGHMALAGGTSVLDNATFGAEGHGAGIYNTQQLTIDDSLIWLNNAAKEGSNGDGGGIYNDGVDGRVTLNRSTVYLNRSSNGGSGGGLWNSNGAVMTLINSTVSGNHSSYNGGGINNTRNAGALTLVNSTIAANQADNEGGGVWNDEASTVRYQNTLFADNTASAGQNCQNTATLLSQGHNLDSDGSCLPPAVRQASDIPNGNANLGPLADNGGPKLGYALLTHALLFGSQAIDAGDDAVCAAASVNGVDERGVPRPQGAHCDIGAYEAAPTLIFLSANSSGKTGGVKFRDEDILAYDPAQDRWLMIFDGSDVGVTKDVDAFNFQRDGTLLLSFNAPTPVPGLGRVDDSDIVRFTPTALGDHTVGTFSWYLRGADVGLTTDGEDIDAIGFTADDHLVVSTIGNFNTPNATGRDEDLFQLNAATLGNPSSGSWSQFFDGSNAGLANEDVNGLWIDNAKHELYFTVKDDFAFDGQPIDGNDIFVCAPTATGGCAYRLFWDGDQHQSSAKHLNGIGIGTLPAIFNATVQAADAEPATDPDAATDDDSDDVDVAEGDNAIFLPLIEQ